MNSGFFAMLFRMKHIKRWGIMHSLIPDYLSSHSLEVGFLAHALALIGNTRFGKSYDCERIALKAIYHDVPEIFTGDIPTPVKYYSGETKKAYDAVEEASLKKLTEMLPDELRGSYSELFDYSEDEKKLIKAADRLAAYIKCSEESSYGSREFEKAGIRLKAILESSHCEEADYFMDNFLDSFNLPIDSIIEKE